MDHNAAVMDKNTIYVWVVITLQYVLIVVFQLEINADEYFRNNVRDLQFNMKRNMDKLRKAPDKKR